jgi:hypothetical protein
VTWVNIVLALLRIVDAILDWSEKSQLRQEGADEEIAKAAIRVAQKTGFAKKTLIQFTGMSESDVLDYLRSLEPADGNGQLLPNLHPTDPAEGRQ